MAEHPLLVKAAKHVTQARSIKDEFEGQAMPAEAARQMEEHIKSASELRKRVTAEMQLTDNEAWLSEPDYKHDMSGVGGAAAKYGDYRGVLLESERKELQTKSFFNFVRKGVGGVEPEVKADLVQDATGELLVPADYAGTILKELPRESVLRNLAFVRPTSSNTVDIGSIVINEASWGKLELGDSPADGLGNPPADKDTIKVWNLNALVKIGVDELDDADDDLASIIRTALSLKLSEMEDDAFAAGAGDGSKQPEGIVTNSDVTLGVASAAGETVVADELKMVKFALSQQFRRRAVWLGHTSAEEKIAILKDGSGNYVWQPNASADEPATLFGHRWYTVDGLPAIDATENGIDPGTDPSVVFGDVRQGYMIADRRRLTVTRLAERYADEGKIGLLFRHRVGGGVIRPKAFATYKL